MLKLFFYCFFYSPFIVLFLLKQLEVFNNCRGREILHADPQQKYVLTLLFTILNKPERFCIAFEFNTFMLWHNHLFNNNNVKSGSKKGRKPITENIRNFIIEIFTANPGISCRQITGELLKLGYDISKSTVHNIIRKFLATPFDKSRKLRFSIISKLKSFVSCDFKVIYNGKKIFYVIFFISNLTRKILHFNITEHPDRDWIVNQLRCLTDGSKTINLITDNDQLLKHVPFKDFNINRIKIPFMSPWYNGIAERFIGTYNRQCLNYYKHLPLSEEKIFSFTKEFIQYYNNYRPHQSLGNLTIPNFEKVLIGQPVYSKKCYRLNNEISDPFENVMSKNFLGGIIKHYYFPYQKVA